jgi:hypothetical protein
MPVIRVPLEFPAKLLRAKVIARHVQEAGLRGVVVFSCGNAAEALRVAFADTDKVVVEVGRKGRLHTNENDWWTPTDIARDWPGLFDATSGHLSIPLMKEIGMEFRKYFERLLGGNGLASGYYTVPTGSGETILCLSLVYPEETHLFVAQYDDLKPETTFDKEQPLNSLIFRMFRPEFNPVTFRRIDG